MLHTVDYHGEPRTSGGDPVTVTAKYEDDPIDSLTCNITDLDNGTYRIKFRPLRVGTIAVNISVVGRPIKGKMLQIEVNKASLDESQWGKRGSGRDQCMQPVSAAFCSINPTLYVLDVGNSRVLLLEEDLTTRDYIENEGKFFNIIVLSCIKRMRNYSLTIL